MTDLSIRKQVANAIYELHAANHQPIVIHGGGPFIKSALDDAHLPHHFIRGLRVTSRESLPVIETVLTLLNKQLAQEITHAIGLTGRDANVLQADILDDALGFVGKITGVNKPLLDTLINNSLIPVIACLAANPQNDNILNINADDAAGSVAGTYQSPVIFLTNVAGVLNDPNDHSSLLPVLSQAEITARIQDGRIAGGMIPKVEAALGAVSMGAAYAVIADGRHPDALKRVLAGEAGTRITA